MINLAISGISGKMGQAIYKIADLDKDIDIISGTQRQLDTQKNITTPTPLDIQNRIIDLDKFDIVVDFTSPEYSINNVEDCLKLNKPIVIGTTGFNNEQLDKIKAASKRIPILLSSNMSIGINLVYKLLNIAAAHLNNWDITISETHHLEKKDSPSGTAISMGEIIAKTLKIQYQNKEELLNSDINFESKRIGNNPGEHSVIFSTVDEEIKIEHKAKDRTIFAKGAIIAAKWLCKQKPGLYSIQDIYN